MGDAQPSESVAAVELRVLGALEVCRHGAVVAIRSPRQRTLLAAPVADARERLDDLATGDDVPLEQVRDEHACRHT